MTRTENMSGEGEKDDGGISRISNDVDEEDDEDEDDEIDSTRRLGCVARGTVSLNLRASRALGRFAVRRVRFCSRPVTNVASSTEECQAQDARVSRGAHTHHPVARHGACEHEVAERGSTRTSCPRRIRHEACLSLQQT